ncbi:MAG: Panacea domain-containing protein [Phycisphaerales bacterium]
MKAAHTALEIARYLLWRVARERPDDPDYLTPLKLQKLLYYVQGWHLVEAQTPAFDDEIQAWRDGPVVVAVYREFRSLGKGPILSAPQTPPELVAPTRAVVESVWSRYKDYSAFKLSDMTHDEMPWTKSRAGLPPSAQSDAPIPLADIADEFAGQLARAQARVRAHAGAIRAAAKERSWRGPTAATDGASGNQ